MAGRAQEGTIFQDKNGRWVAMIELGRGPNGKRVRRLRRGRTKAEVKAKLAAMREELRDSGSVSSATRKVETAVETYREGRTPSPNDDWMLGLVLSALGSHRVKELTVADCDAFLAACGEGKLGKRPIGTNHLRRIKQCLAAVLQNEMRLGMVRQNVAEVAKLPTPRVEPLDRRSLTADELSRLLDAAEGPYVVLIDLCGRNALRPAEARALRWQDVDQERRELQITGQMNRNNERGPVKRATNAARTIALDQATIDRLNAWSQEQTAIKAGRRSAWTEADFVATGGIGQPIGRELFSRELRRLCQQLDVTPHVTPYELRHTAISSQADAGRSSWEIADWAGTSEAMISSRYRHRLRETARLRPAPTTQSGLQRSEARGSTTPTAGDHRLGRDQ